MRTWSNELQRWNGTKWLNIATIQNDNWFHVRLDFECSGGGYEGLAQYHWQIFINGGLPHGPFPFIFDREKDNIIVLNGTLMV